MYHAGIYCRVSDEERKRGKEYSSSICAQIQVAEDYIMAHGDMEKAGVYTDDGVSGSRFDRRAFRRMLSDMEKGFIDTVIFKDVSRLGREHITVNYYLGKYFPERGIRVISILDDYDSQKSIYDERLELRALFDALYLRDISQKTKSVIRMKKCRGEYMSGEAPLGYLKSKTIHNHLELDPYGAEIVREIFRMYLEGSGCAVIARILNEKNVPTPARYKKEVLKTDYAWKVGKGLWSVSAVAGILANPVYTGAIVLKKNPEPSDNREWGGKLFLENQQCMENAHEAIISKKDFEQVQIQRRERRIPYFEKEGKVHKYAGLLFCGECGMAMRKRYLVSRGGYDGYVCGFHQKMGKDCCKQNYISFEKLDELAVFAVNRQLIQCGMNREKLQREAMSLAEVCRKKACVQMRCEQARERRKKLYEKFADGVLSEDEYLERKRICERDFCEFEKEEQEQKKTADRTERLLSVVCKGELEVDQLTRKVLEELIERIDVYPGQRLEIRFRFANPEWKGQGGGNVSDGSVLSFIEGGWGKQGK